MEEEELFPLIEKVFTQEQLDLVTGFTPFKLGKKITAFPRQRAEPASISDQNWLKVVEEHFNRQGPNTGSIVLFPGYRPELCVEMAKHLGLEFYDYQKEAMAPLGLKADSINFFELNNTLREKGSQYRHRGPQRGSLVERKAGTGKTRLVEGISGYGLAESDRSAHHRFSKRCAHGPSAGLRYRVAPNPVDIIFLRRGIDFRIYRLRRIKPRPSFRS